MQVDAMLNNRSSAHSDQYKAEVSRVENGHGMVSSPGFPPHSIDNAIGGQSGAHEKQSSLISPRHLHQSGVNSAQLSRDASPLRSMRSFHPDASLVLVGIRGCGKRSLGFIAATALGRRLITEDHFFEESTSLSRQEYLKQHGNREFHRRDIEVSRKMLDENARNCVIECGLGSLTTGVQEHLREYAITNPVVYLIREMAEIQQFLKLDDRSTRLLANGDPTHRRCSNFEYFNLEDRTTDRSSEDKTNDRLSPAYSFKLKDAREDFTYFVRQITGASTLRSNYTSPFSLYEMPVEKRLFTHALLLKLSNLEDLRIDLNILESGGDAIEVLVDRWSKVHYNILAKQLALLRRKVAVPIIISATTDMESGDSQRSGASQLYMTVLEHALRLGVEFISVDLTLDADKFKKMVDSKGFTRIIGNYLENRANTIQWGHQAWIDHYDQAVARGCDIVRLLKRSVDRDDNLAAQMFADKIRRREGQHPPLIAYNVGDVGRTSQLFNPILTSVTHEALSTEKIGTAPLTITSKAAIQALFQSFVLDPLAFFVFGANVPYSLSPAMHNAGYNACGLNHKYTAKNVNSLAEVGRIARDPYFGGASIVQPYKVSIVDQLASKSRHAEAIGAVNTLMPIRAQADGTVPSLEFQASQRNRAGTVVAWYGDNTDWIGINTVLNRNLSPRNVVRPGKTTGLVIGAGGMARAAVYAMLRLGCRKIYIYNRTAPNADKIATHFNSWASSSDGEQVVTVLQSRKDPWPTAQLPPTMIVSCVPAQSINNLPEANFEMPSQWLGSISGGVVLELAYKPLNTPLLKQMRRFREETGRAWVVCDGLETLPEQAVAQFELFTGRKAPRSLMRLECLRNYRGEEGQYDENAIKARLESVR